MIRATFFLLALASTTAGSWEPSYGSAVRACQSRRVPLVVGVGCAAPDSDRWVTCCVKTLKWGDYDPEFKPPCIVVAMPWVDHPVWVATLPATATKDDVARAIPSVWKVPAASPPGLPKRTEAASRPSFRRAANC